jgi:exopolysaccharide production protein ExoF
MITMVFTPECARAEYEIAIGDKLRIFVFGQKDVENSAIVDETGSIWVPAIGHVVVANHTVAKVRETIGSKFSSNDTVRIEDVNVEVIEFRPFYIDGAVNKPGSYVYNLGLTVRQAIALAGGRHRLVPDDPRASHSSLWSQYIHRQARTARLQAELDGKTHFEWAPPQDLEVPPPMRKRLSDLEQRQFEARKANFEREMANAQDLVTLFKREIEALERQDTTLEKEDERATRILSELRALKDRGVVSSDRIAATERDVFSSRYARDSTRSQLASARRQYREVEGKKEQLEPSRRQELTADLNLVVSELDLLESQLALVAQRMQPENLTIERLCGPATKDDEILIYRQEGARTIKLESTEDSRISPGDAIQVNKAGRRFGATCPPPQAHSSSKKK